MNEPKNPRPAAPADDEAIARAARAAGLDAVWQQFPDAVRTAFGQAMKLRAGFDRRAAPADEPWPPMTAGHTE